MHLAVSGRERRDQPEGGLAVERAAALLEQRGLLVDRRVAVEREQFALDLGDGRSARNALELLGEHLVVRVEVAEVVRRHRAEIVEQAARQLELAGELVAVFVEQLGQHVLAVDAGRAAPTSGGSGPTWSTTTRAGSTPSQRANCRWKPIATLQSPTARWP